MLLGVTLAISSIVAVHQISQRVVTSLASVTPPHLSGVTHQLRRPGLVMDDYFELRSRWRAGDLPGVSSLMPVVTGTAGRWRVIGLDAFSGVPAALGLALLAPGEVVAGPQAGAGETITPVPGGPSVRIAARHDTLAQDLLITGVGTAQALLGRPDQALDAVGVVIVSPAQQLIDWTERLMPGFSAGIDVQTYALEGWDVSAMAATDPAIAFARSVLFNLGALGSLALVVAWLLVYQVSVIWLRRRAVTLTRLRQMGVTEAELRRVFLGSLIGLGLTASLLGLVLGGWLADGLAHAATGFSEPLTGVGLDRWVLAKALGSALGVCLIGGWIAARREAGGPGVASGRRLFHLLCLLVLGAGIWGMTPGSSLAGGFAAVAAVCLLTLAAISPLLAGLRAGARHLRGRLVRRMGLRELLWYPGDLAVAIGALVLALATSVAMSLMVDSFRQDFRAMLDQRVVSDLFLSGEAGEDLSELAKRLETVPGVTRVQRYGRSELQLDGLRVSLSFSAFDLPEARRYGLSRPLARGEALVSERLAGDLALSTGQSFMAGGMRLTVAGIFPGYGDSTPRLVLREEDAAALGIRRRYERLSVDTQEPALVRQTVAALAPGVSVEARSAIRSQALEIFDATFAITRALTFLALIVASVGLYNALLALELLQQGVRRLLHAMGLDARELRQIAAWRVIGVGFMSLMLALPLGIAMGWLLCRVVNPRAFGWSLDLELAAGSFLWPVLTALAVMAVVGLAPTPRESMAEQVDVRD